MLVIGGAGFIGSHLVDRLLAEGQAVDVVDDLSTGSLANLADARAEAPGWRASCRSTRSTPRGDDLATLIAHAPAAGDLPPGAAAARHERRPSRSAASFTSMLGVLERRAESGVDEGRRRRCRRPRSTGTRPAASCRSRRARCEPRGVRGVVAKAIVDLLTAYRESCGIEFTALALSTVYGPRQRPDGGVVAACRRRGGRRRAAAHRRRRQTRDFVYVDDVVDALVRAGRARQRAGGQRRHRRADVAPRPVGAGGRRSGRAADAVAARARRARRASPCRRCGPASTSAWSPWTTLAEGLDALR